MALPRLREVVYLTYAQYLEIKTNGSITVDGVTHYWDENAFYVTNQEGTAPTTNDYTDLDNKPILDTNNTEELPTVQSETLNGVIKLHKISKTGKSTDLVDSNTLVRFSNVSNTPQANMLVRYDSNGYLIANVVESSDGDNLVSIMNGKIVVGEMTCELSLQGSQTRPKYNSVDLALRSDIPSFAVSNTTGGVANAVVLDWTNNVLSAQLHEDITAKLQKMLMLPMTRPTSTELVAVDTSGGQAMVDIGANLTLSGDTLSADLSSCAKNADFNKTTQTKFGDNIVCKKKLLWTGGSSGQRITSSQEIADLTLNENVAVGDVLEIELKYGGTGGSASQFNKFRIPDTQFLLHAAASCYTQGTGDAFINSVDINLEASNTLRVYATETATIRSGSVSFSRGDTVVFNIWKIIE